MCIIIKEMHLGVTCFDDLVGSDFEVVTQLTIAESLHFLKETDCFGLCDDFVLRTPLGSNLLAPIWCCVNGIDESSWL